ncbi:phosphodiester glycosidase family protein [Myxococcota bacterium]|nr:phosphodiester glycosidase family protein [Myxococcota bacterium]MBU1379223.1 phosphodiester glycosidase family protein [Myxococcota bacterium]MBU1496278.1 phosphodiester glycosidase family protein [Myxococcota bacterium]
MTVKYSKSMSFITALCGVVITIFSFAGKARAADTWSYPHPGMALLTRTMSGPVVVYALRVDTCARGISHRATTETERQRTPTSFRNLVGAQATINGDFFNYTGYYPIGLAVGDGTKWHNDATTMGFLAAGPDRIELSPVGTLVSTLPSWVRNAVGGFPTLVLNGTPQYGATSPDHCTSRHPRTVVGLSKDRQYLWLVIVDGRTSSSIGMTCNELADLMVSLGAHNAVNFDGGGSSAMSISGIGTVNDPSDGSERVVSNHWAVFASGSGAPGSCDLWMDELVVDSGVLNHGASTDLNGDGMSDFCARGSAGFRCYLSTGTTFDLNPWMITDMSDANGWDDEMQYSTIRTGDMNGDGLMDVCARHADGIRCWPSTGTAFGSAVNGPNWASSVGWASPQHATTFRLADINGDGLDDFCALASAGWICHTSTGTGIGPQVQGPVWQSGGGWHEPWRYGTIRMGDLNGDGRADVCGRGANGMTCALSNGSGFEAEFAGPPWSDAAGFTDVAYWSTIRMVDIDSDGLADLCARTSTGIECYRSIGNGSFGPAIAGPGISDASGWKDMDNTSTVRFADINGDGLADICARANAGIRCWLNNGNSWPTQINGPDWDEASGFDDFRIYTSINLGDINNDQMADICARKSDGVQCFLSDGNGFPTQVTGPVLADSSGWAAYQYFSTIRFGGQVNQSICEVVADDDSTCDGLDDDCDGIIDEDAAGDCDDGDACNGLETCSTQGLGCVAGTPPDCEDRGCLSPSGCCPGGTHLEGNECIADPCDIENDTCSDDNACNGLEVCGEEGVCIPGTPLDCGAPGCIPNYGCCPAGSVSDGDDCIAVACDPENDTCDDHNACNGNEYCSADALVCLPGTPPDCGIPGCIAEIGCCPEGTKALDGACRSPDSDSEGCSCRAGTRPRTVLFPVLMVIALITLFLRFRKSRK